MCGPGYDSVAKVKNIYLICPVRNCSEEVQKQLEEYVETKELLGYKVHFPPRDVEQDQSGIGICEAHRGAMVG